MNAAIQVGDVLDGTYEIQELRRHAPDKSVYIGYDRKFRRKVVIDVFRSNRPIVPGGLSVSAWEAQVLGQLGDHPNIADVLAHLEEGDTAIMVSRYLSGGSLLDLIKKSHKSDIGLPIERTLEVATEIAQALAHIHQHGILYRDLQPRNVLFDEWETVKLVDFDTAVLLDDSHMSDLSHRAVIEYMAPEMLEGSNADDRADLYSLGATIYEMIVGRPPFVGSRADILAAKRESAPQIPEKDGITQALRDLVNGLLAPDRQQRPRNAAEVVECLKEVSTSRAEIERFLASDESARLEFKASLRVPLEPKLPGGTTPDRVIEQAIEHSTLKTIAAFQNTEGGVLIIGVSDGPDGRTVVGIDVDYPRVKWRNADGWRCTFDSLVSEHLGVEVMSCIDLHLEPWGDRTIAVIRCSQREEPTWLGEDLFVRRTASSVKLLSVREAIAWARQRWGLSIGEGSAIPAARRPDMVKA